MFYLSDLRSITVYDSFLLFDFYSNYFLGFTLNNKLCFP